MRREALGGILLFSLGILMFAMNDALGKWLVGSYGLGELMLLRSLGAMLVLVPLVSARRPSLAVRAEWRLHALRVACMTLDAFAFYGAARGLPLADVMTIYLAAPLAITALSVPFLGETVGRFRWAAVGIGFGGVVLALQPGSAGVSPYALIALAGCLMFASAICITRQLRDTHWLTLTLLQFGASALAGAVAAPFAWVTPTLGDAGLMALVGLTAMGCHVALTRALSMAPASLLAPFQYASIVWAAILGWAVFGDVPGYRVVAGSAVIVASGLAVLWRERRRGMTRTEVAAPVP